jgi:curved DNA-binding protein CbpA
MTDFIDLYELLGVPYDAAPVDIRRAYRTKSLKCHPDKVGTDNPELVNEFLELGKAYDTLTDDDKKRLYDAQLHQRLANKKKLQQLDAQQRRLRDELLARENANEQQMEEKVSLQKEREEIDRLRELGMQKLREKEAARNKESVLKRVDVENDQDKTLKLRWKRREGYKQWTDQTLSQLLSAFGKTSFVVVKTSDSNKASAVVQFESISGAAATADAKRVKHELLKGIDVEWVSTSSLEREPARVEEWRRLKNAKITLSYPKSALSDDEYEKVTLAKMRAMKMGA